MLDSLARARQAVPDEFPLDALRIVMSELFQPDRRGKFEARDITILIKVLPLLPEGAEEVQAVINSAQGGPEAADAAGAPQLPSYGSHDSSQPGSSGPGYMVLGDAVKALRVAVQ